MYISYHTQLEKTENEQSRTVRVKKTKTKAFPELEVKKTKNEWKIKLVNKFFRSGTPVVGVLGGGAP